MGHCLTLPFSEKTSTNVTMSQTLNILASWVIDDFPACAKSADDQHRLYCRIFEMLSLLFETDRCVCFDA